MGESKEEKKIAIQRYSTTELAPLLDRSARAFRRELALVKHRYGVRMGQKWSQEQVRMILDDFGSKYKIVILDDVA